MNCFYHPSIVAIGTCKSCSKGLCPSCAADLGKGLACRGRCEKDVADVIGLIENNIKRAPFYNQIADNARKGRYFGGIFQSVVGLIFLGFAAYQAFTVGFEPSDSLSWGLGSFFLICGLYSLYRAVRLSQSMN